MSSVRQSPTEAGASKDSRSILIVEDEKVLLDLLVHRFEKADFKVLTAISGPQACDQIGTHKPDVILMDNLLPQLNGLDVLEMLRRHPEPFVATTPVILVTAQPSAEIKQKSLQTGADAFLFKPYSLAELHDRCCALIEQHRIRFKLN